MLRLRHFAQNAALVLISTSFAFLALEVVLRVVGSGGLANEEIRVYDPKLSYKFLPNVSTTIDVGEGPKRIVTNEYGYVGETFPKVKPAGEYRIANIGDSYVEGVQEVDWDGTFVAELERRLNETDSSGPEYRSLNFGVSGRGQIEEYWVYKYLVREIDPDLTILWFTEANDLANNFLPQGPPSAVSENFTGRIKYLLKKSAFATFIFQRTKDVPWILRVYQRIGLTNAVYNQSASGMPSMEEVINYSLRADDRETQERAYEMTREILGNLKTDIASDGGRLLVVLIPHYTDKEPYKAEFFKQNFNTKPEEYDFTQARTRITALFEDLGVEYLDLLPPLLEYEEGKNGIPDCGELWGNHFTACGHRVTAEIVARYILSSAGAAE